MYLEPKISTLQDILLKVYGVYTTVCDPDSFTLLQTSASRGEALQQLLYLDKDIRKTADGKPFDPEKQYFYANSLGLIWLLCVDERYAYLLGPAFTDNYSLLDILNKLESRNLSSRLKREMIDFLQSIPIIASHRMQQYGMMLHCCLRESAPTIDQLVMLNDLSHTPTDVKPAAAIATNYALEETLIKSSAAAGGSFAPTLQFKKLEIHTVFLRFSNFNLGQNLSPSALVDLFIVSLSKSSGKLSGKAI